MEVDTQKRQPDIENENKKAQEMRKEAMERFGETRKRKGQEESDIGDRNKVEGVVKKWLIFFEKNLNKIANLDQNICKKKTMKGKLGKDSITIIIQNQHMKAQQNKKIQILQEQQAQILALLLQRQ